MAVTMAPDLQAVRLELSAVIAAAAPGISAANDLCTACVDLLEVDGAAVSVVYDGASRGTFGSGS